MIRAADFAREGAEVRALVDEYAAWLDFDLCFQNYDDEMRRIATVYGAPLGAFFVADVDGQLAGCVGLRPRGDGIGELKRLYVRPAFQGLGLGRALVDAVIAHARRAGLSRLVLDAAPQTGVAQTLYLASGFREVPPYYATPIAGTRFFELLIGPDGQTPQ